MRTQAVNSGIKGLIIGIIIAVFGWADIEYYLTPLSFEVNQLMITIGGFISLCGFGYIIYGLVARASPSHTTAKLQTTPPPSRKPTPPPIHEMKDSAPLTAPSIREREIIKEIEVVYCPYCKVKNSARSSFCRNCGGSLH